MQPMIAIFTPFKCDVAALIFAVVVCRLNKVQTTTAKIKRSEEHTSELQSRSDLVCRLLLEKKNDKRKLLNESEGRDLYHNTLGQLDNIYAVADEERMIHDDPRYESSKHTKERSVLPIEAHV